MSCATCNGQGVVNAPWPSGYPHATPCPECNSRKQCGCNTPDCPGRDAATILIKSLRTELAEAVALLESFSSGIDCDTIQFGREGECALLTEGFCCEHRRRAFLAKHQKPEVNNNIGETK